MGWPSAYDSDDEDLTSAGALAISSLPPRDGPELAREIASSSSIHVPGTTTANGQQRAKFGREFCTHLLGFLGLLYVVLFSPAERFLGYFSLATIIVFRALRLVLLFIDTFILLKLIVVPRCADTYRRS